MIFMNIKKIMAKSALISHNNIGELFEEFQKYILEREEINTIKFLHNGDVDQQILLRISLLGHNVNRVFKTYLITDSFTSQSYEENILYVYINPVFHNVNNTYSLVLTYSTEFNMIDSINFNNMNTTINDKVFNNIVHEIVYEYKDHKDYKSKHRGFLIDTLGYKMDKYSIWIWFFIIGYFLGYLLNVFYNSSALC